MLILGPVTRIGVDDKLRIWQMLRQHERVDLRHHAISIAVDDQGRMGDVLQRGVTLGCAVCFPIP